MGSVTMFLAAASVDGRAVELNVPHLPNPAQHDPRERSWGSLRSRLRKIPAEVGVSAA